jgi:hypothetical protein
MATAWQARVGKLQQGSSLFIAKGSAPASGTGFCGALLPGDLYVGVPSMGAVSDYLGSSRPNLTTRWAERVRSAA